MLTMAKKSGRPKKPNTMKPFQLRLHPDIRKQLEKFADEERKDRSEVVRSAITEFLKSHGYWPPPPKD